MAKGAFWVFALLVLVIVAVVLFFVVVFVLSEPKVEFEGIQTAALFATVISELVMLWAAWRWSVRKYGCSWASLGLRLFQLSSGLPFVVAVLLAAFLVNAVYVFSVTALGWKSLIPSPLPEVFRVRGADMVLVTFLAVGLAPFAEEVFFRGFFFGGLQARLGFVLAAAVSALVFSLGHLQLGVLVPIFILGVFLAWLYARTGSLWPCIITHMVYNGLGLLAYQMT